MKKLNKIKIEGDLIFRDQVSKTKIRNAAKLDNVEMDLGGMTFIDSRGIELLFKTASQIKKRGGQLRLVNVNKQALEIMQICGLSEIIYINPSGKDNI